MDHIDLNQAKETLSQWLLANTTSSNDIISKFPESNQNIADPLDRASHQAEMEYTFIKLGRESLNKSNVLKALKRIEKGSYGVCEECGRNISINRLRAMPDASHCLKCQSEMESNIRS